LHIKNRKQTATLTEANKKKLNTMKTNNKNLNTSSASRYEHFPKTPRQTWKDFKPSQILVSLAYQYGVSVEQATNIYFN